MLDTRTVCARHHQLALVYRSWRTRSCLRISYGTAFSIKTRFSFRASLLLNFQPEKCPFCLGHSLCDKINDLRLEITLVDFVVGLLNHKYVFYGRIANRSVVIKRLVRKEEISAFESQIVSISDDFTRLSNADFYDRSVQMLNHSFVDVSYKLRLCPTLENARKLLNPLLRDGHVINIWTTLHLNPEPLMLQLLRKEDGWPVPEYIGSCGRIMIVECCGKTIENYLNHPLLFRVHIMEQLLQIAYNFTFSDPRFGYYFRDVSYSNFVLDSDLKTRIVDLEHIIVVDKNTSTINQSESWFETHESEDYYCEECLIYSPKKICSHHLSDHNYYAVCKEFLHTIYPKDLGLLHSLSDSHVSSSLLESLRYYAEECIHPSQNNTRFQIAEKFLEVSAELKIRGNFSVDSARDMI